ncbi:reverse transcriptase domain-containing protein [Tanacetum coccineum]|uniref:Reverse transcriptase domain-containing protein n=1 Tax=Tanacetum coccineum TaxID=301880 RepID=A0ABQ5GWZ5_9ASTR
MRTRSQARRLRQQQRHQQQAPPNLVEPPKDTMADNRTMAELLHTMARHQRDNEDAIFFPPSKTTNLRNEITNFKQRFDESFSEAWDRFKDLLRACPHHGFSELHQLDTFYNALNVNDQDSLNSAAGGNFLDKRPADCSSIIESKSKVRHSRSKAIIAKVSTSTSTSGVSPDVAELKDMQPSLLTPKGEIEKAITTRTEFHNSDPHIPRSEEGKMKPERARNILKSFRILRSISKWKFGTSLLEPMLITNFSTLTPFKGSDFILEEIEAELSDTSYKSGIDDAECDPENDILLLEAILNSEPLSPLPNHANYFPEVRKELKNCEAKTDGTSIDEPPEVELKDLPPHLEYAFLEGDNKLPVIIAKDLSVGEKLS